MRAIEPFRRAACQKHFDGISRSRLAQRERLSSATIERWFVRYLELLAGERIARECRQIPGIDEHFVTRRRGYTTTFCDLKNHKVYEVVPGRSEAALESYLERLEGKHQVKVVCMNLAPGYCALVRKHFPGARIVADRFHVMCTLNHHFLACWKNIDPAGARHRACCRSCGVTATTSAPSSTPDSRNISAAGPRWKPSTALNNAWRICCWRRAGIRRAAANSRAVSSGMWLRSVVAGSRH
jgi:hypothetical protein